MNSKNPVRHIAAHKISTGIFGFQQHKQLEIRATKFLALAVGKKSQAKYLLKK